VAFALQGLDLDALVLLDIAIGQALTGLGGLGAVYTLDRRDILRKGIGVTGRAKKLAGHLAGRGTLRGFIVALEGRTFAAFTREIAAFTREIAAFTRLRAAVAVTVECGALAALTGELTTFAR